MQKGLNELLLRAAELLCTGLHWQHWPLQPGTPHVLVQVIVWPTGQAIFTCSQASPCSRSEQRLPAGHCWNGMELLWREELLGRGELLSREELLLGTHRQHWPLQPATPQVLVQLMV